MLRLRCIVCVWAACVPWWAAQADSPSAVLVIVGAPGTDEYDQQFRQWAADWEKASRQAGARFVAVGQDAPGDREDRQRARDHLAAFQAEPADVLYVVLIGHGTFDGTEAKFNLRGPDLSARQMAEWLQAYPAPLAVINCASSSSPFINQLSGSNRVIITATKSGYEYNFARFGQHMSRAVTDPQADLDKDGQASLLEAFLLASGRTAEFYQQQARLATESALLDDNGDGQGTPASWFRGVRATRTAKDGAAADGLRAHQLHLVRSGREQAMTPQMRSRRDELERQVEALRQRKPQMAESDYYDQLEIVLLELARVYAEVGH